MNRIYRVCAWGAMASASVTLCVTAIIACSTRPDDVNREGGAYLFWPMMGAGEGLDVPRAQAAAAGGAGDAEALLARWALFIKEATESAVSLRYSKADFAELGEIRILLTAMGLSPSGSALTSDEVEGPLALGNLYVDTICLQACTSSDLEFTPEGTELLRIAVLETEFSIHTRLFYESLISYLHGKKRSVEVGGLVEAVRGQLKATTEGATMVERLGPRGSRDR